MRTRGHMLPIGVLWLTMDRLPFVPFERATVLRWGCCNGEPGTPREEYPKRSLDFEGSEAERRAVAAASAHAGAERARAF